MLFFQDINFNISRWILFLRFSSQIILFLSFVYNIPFWARMESWYSVSVVIIKFYTSLEKASKWRKIVCLPGNYNNFFTTYTMNSCIVSIIISPILRPSLTSYYFRLQTGTKYFTFLYRYFNLKCWSNVDIFFWK